MSSSYCQLAMAMVAVLARNNRHKAKKVVLMCENEGQTLHSHGREARARPTSFTKKGHFCVTLPNIDNDTKQKLGEVSCPQFCTGSSNYSWFLLGRHWVSVSKWKLKCDKIDKICITFIWSQGLKRFFNCPNNFHDSHLIMAHYIINCITD